uniref:CBM20 domain-containing protein n=1 Tax=Chromera velia CCMP2878 TaxID=1169474 RepID=A0A0G4G6D5_9ALVE|eukprot:Cvel_4242.t1-p1 / transcript=Cvel_4242.t1 / gene=Cvel_4242 / organism=Chromera_velia_CCMP2878 / gene_product=Zinc finger protein 571, putative / transcript_product=Zinc finger protein 571, putative / location=Cvel_scaffold183:107636-109672(+) / protein_length=679 / sequence_SO=supercontig / SO=protein_coding / is_pseudo=false
MKGFIAFIAHCPEVRENQRVVVVGECPELGGWELGGALSLAPTPCGRPWWVSSEVEVNLPESPMGVSGDFVNGVGAGGEVGGVGVSDLKFRLLAIPNDGEEVQVPYPGNLLCLEPLRGSDFRIVRLVSAPLVVDCSSVGERGVNTICVGAEGGGEHQKRKVVGVSVEWGVPESVQLALLPLSTYRQTENPQHDDLSARPSEIACPHSSEGRKQTNSRIIKPANDSDSHDTSSIQSAVSRATSPEQKVLQRPGFPSAKVEKEERRYADGSTFAVKRRRSESDLAQIEADECDEVSGCSGERRGVASRESGGGSTFLREEKQRRLTVSLSDSAPLSSKMCGGRGDPIAGGKAVLSENDRRGGEGGEVKRDRHGKILCLHGRIRCTCKECGGKSICEHGRQRYAHKYPSHHNLCTESEGDRAHKCPSLRTPCTCIAADHVHKYSSHHNLCSESEGDRAHICPSLRARSAEEKEFVSTADSALDARNVAGRVFVSTVGSDTSARSAEGRAFVSTVAFALGAKIVVGKVFVSTAGSAFSAGNVAGRLFVSTAGTATFARSAEGGAFVFTERTVDTAMSASRSPLFLLDAFVFMFCFLHYLMSVKSRCPPFSLPFLLGVPTKSVHRSVFSERSVHSARSASMWPLLFLLLCLQFDVLFPLSPSLSVPVRMQDEWMGAGRGPPRSV